MGKGRLEAFSDGVLAIIITIMVLELRVPHGETLADLGPLAPKFFSYLLSFVYVGIYWNNHHHLLHATHKVSGPVMWANHHLLFWLSLVPVSTAWMGEHHEAPVPTAAYGFVLLMASVAYWLLVKAIIYTDGVDSAVGRAVGRDGKGMLSSGLYILAISLAIVQPSASLALYGFVAVIWLMPDARMEHALREHGTDSR